MLPLLAAVPAVMMGAVGLVGGAAALAGGAMSLAGGVIVVDELNQCVADDREVMYVLVPVDEVR